MSQKQIALHNKHTHRRKTGKKTRPETDPLKSNATLLQHQVGNRAMQQAIAQRALAQREVATPSAFNPLDPAVLRGAAEAVIAQNEAPIRHWLAENTNSLRLLAMDELVGQVRRNVSEAGRLADGEIQSLVSQWAAENDVSIPPVSILGGGSAGLSVQFPDAVKKAFSVAIDGVEVVPLPGGRLNISAKGATAKLKRGNISLGWTGNLGMDIPMEGFQLAGQLDKDKWEVTLSVPGESFVPDLSKLAGVFNKAETAMRGMVEATSRFGKLDDIPKVMKAISPHVEPVKEAVEALVETAKAPSVSAGLKIEGQTPRAETPGGSSASGITVMATVTIRF